MKKIVFARLLLATALAFALSVHAPVKNSPKNSPGAGRRTQVRRSGVHGRGVFALRALAAGDTVRFYGAIRQTNLQEIDAGIIRNLNF